MMRDLSDALQVIYGATEASLVASTLLDDQDNAFNYAGFVNEGVEVSQIY